MPEELDELAAGCLHDDTIFAFLDHTLSPSGVRQVEAHLATCVACRRLISVAVDGHDGTSIGAGSETLQRPSHLAMPLALGSTLGRFQIEGELGTGGMGHVYAAFDPVLERRIALKVLRGLGDHASARLMREARAMAGLAHANIATVHEVGTADGRDYIAMELVDGGTLAGWLAESPRSRTEVLDAFVEAGRGLSAAHAAGIVHRDFKPHNVLRWRDGRIVVTDFGLASETAGASGEPAERPSALTLGGQLVGTPAYMAPEQWRAQAITPATDQFAFCVALWEALAGARPYPGITGDELHAAVLRGPGVLDRSGVPASIAPILVRGLSVDPAERWPSIDALLAALRIELVVERAEHELARGNPQGALDLVGTVDVPGELLARVRAASEARTRLAHDHDPAVGRRLRIGIGVALGGFFTLFPLINEWTGALRYRSHGQQSMQYAILLAIALACAWAARRRVVMTVRNRGLILGLLVLFFAQAVLSVAGWIMMISVAHIQTLTILVWMIVTAQLAIYTSRHLAASSLGYLAAFLIAACWPATLLYMIAASNFVTAVTVMWMWSAEPP
jgi:hypothetical protein